MSSLPLRRALYLLLTAALFALVPGLRAQDAHKLYRADIDLKTLDFRTDWYGVYLKDAKESKKAGTRRMERTRDADGSIRETDQFVVKLASFDQKVDFTMGETSVYEGKAPYALVRASYFMTSGKLKYSVTVRKLDVGYEFVHEAPGVRQVKVMKDLSYGLTDAVAMEIWIRKAPKANETIVFSHLDISDQTLEVQTSRLVSDKTSLVKGVDVRILEVETISKDKGIKALTRHYANGQVISNQVAIWELRLESEALAKNIEYSQDLFVMGLVKINGPLGDSRKVRELVVEVEGKDAEVFSDGPRQSVRKGDTKGGPVLFLGKSHGRATKATNAEIKDALAETPACPISNPKVTALAKEAVGDAKTPAEKVAKLVAFVHKYVQPHLSGNLPQIEDLIENKKGDCKSYALLFNNLARAAGIPAREVSGMVYIGDQQKAFGGHAWNEVVLDGVWVPIDASTGETEVNATHVSFGADDRAAGNMLNTLGQLSFRLVEVKHGK